MGLYAAVMLLVFYGFDYVIESDTLLPRRARAISDGFAHGSVALLLLLPLRLFCRWPLSVVAFGTIVAMAIDADHFIAAGSFAVMDAIAIPGRPLTHSLPFAAAMALAALVVSRRIWPAATVFVALTSHVLRDATSGNTPVVLHAHVGIPWWCYAVACVAMLFGMVYLAASGRMQPPEHRFWTRLTI
jgi:hypothetical protein